MNAGPLEIRDVSCDHGHAVRDRGCSDQCVTLGASIRHENVVRTYTCDVIRVDDEQRHVLAMEYVEGQTLRELLQELETVPEELCRHVGREICRGLAAIHGAGDRLAAPARPKTC